MWFLFQSAVFFAVAASNVQWHWTPNGYLVGLIGVGLAYGLTSLLSDRCWHQLSQRLPTPELMHEVKHVCES
jgi:hypothetical protein